MNTKKKISGELWNATVELDSDLTEDEIDHIIDALATYGVAVGNAPQNHATVTLSLPAFDLVQAVTIAVTLTERATEKKAVGVEALPTEEFDARSGLEPIPALVSGAEAAEMLGVSRVRVNQMIAEGKIRTARRVGNSHVIAYQEVVNMTEARRGEVGDITGPLR